MTDYSVEDFWEHAPSGLVSPTRTDRIIRVNATVARWLGYEANALCGRMFTDLLTVGGRILYETHFGPLLQMGGDLNGVTVDVVAPTEIECRCSSLRMSKSTQRRSRNCYGSAWWMPPIAVPTKSNSWQARRRAVKEQGRVREFADTLRRALLPPVLSPPAGLEAAEYYNTASVDDVGGDFYDLFPLSRTTWGFFLGDVSGKGVDAAVVTGLTRYTLRAAAVYDDDPVEVLHNLNTVLSQELGGELNRFCTLIYGKLTRCDNGFDVHLASGGHPPPLLFYADGSAYYVDTIGGQAVGMTNEPHFVASQFVLAPGDTLVLYTDGLTEASTGVGRERYDDEGALLRFAKAHSPTTASAIVDAVSGLLEGLGSGVEDDTAVLALGVPRTKLSSRRGAPGWRRGLSALAAWV